MLVGKLAFLPISFSTSTFLQVTMPLKADLLPSSPDGYLRHGV